MTTNGLQPLEQLACGCITDSLGRKHPCRLHVPAECANCGLRPGTEIWTEGTLAFVHGFYAKWCSVCMLQKQIEHAETSASRLPELGAKLLAAYGEPPS